MVSGEAALRDDTKSIAMNITCSEDIVFGQPTSLFPSNREHYANSILRNEI